MWYIFTIIVLINIMQLITMFLNTRVDTRMSHIVFFMIRVDSNNWATVTELPALIKFSNCLLSIVCIVLSGPFSHRRIFFCVPLSIPVWKIFSQILTNFKIVFGVSYLIYYYRLVVLSQPFILLQCIKSVQVTVKCYKCSSTTANCCHNGQIKKNLPFTHWIIVITRTSWHDDMEYLSTYCLKRVYTQINY